MYSISLFIFVSIVSCVSMYVYTNIVLCSEFFFHLKYLFFLLLTIYLESLFQESINGHNARHIITIKHYYEIRIIILRSHGGGVRDNNNKGNNSKSKFVMKRLSLQ